MVSLNGFRHTSCLMTKPTKWPLPQWRLRSAWASTQWVAKDLSFLHADSEDWSDAQTVLLEPKRRFIAQSLSYSPFHRLEMTEILLKGCKTLTHPSIPDWSKSSLGAHAILLVLSWGGSWCSESSWMIRGDQIIHRVILELWDKEKFSDSLWEVCVQILDFPICAVPLNFSIDQASEPV